MFFNHLRCLQLPEMFFNYLRCLQLPKMFNTILRCVTVICDILYSPKMFFSYSPEMFTITWDVLYSTEMFTVTWDVLSYLRCSLLTWDVYSYLRYSLLTWDVLVYSYLRCSLLTWDRPLSAAVSESGEGRWQTWGRGVLVGVGEGVAAPSVVLCKQ